MKKSVHEKSINLRRYLIQLYKNGKPNILLAGYYESAEGIEEKARDYIKAGHADSMGHVNLDWYQEKIDR